METLTTFLGWCTVINLGILLFWTIFIVVCPGWVHRTHSRWFPMSRETFNVAMYAFLGGFKIAWIFLNLVPYLALRIIAA